MSKTPNNAESTTVAARMRRTVPRGRAAANYASNDPVTRDVALALGIGQPSAHQLLYGRDRLNRRTQIVIDAFRRHGATERLARWTAPIRVALAGVALDPLTRQLLHDAQLADIAEDEAENEYRLDGSPEKARLWVKKIDTLVEWLLRLRHSLVKQHNLDNEA